MNDRNSTKSQIHFAPTAWALLALAIPVSAAFWLVFAKTPRALEGRGFGTNFVGAVATGVFTTYSFGVLVLFAWVIGRIVGGKPDVKVEVPLLSDDDGKLSLARVQMFLWTLVMLFAWLFQLVLNPLEFPELPNQALMLMGISGATYLGGKQLDATKRARATAPVKPEPVKPEPLAAE